MITHAENIICTNPDATTFQEIISCLNEDYKFYDNELNKIYKLKMKTLMADKQKNLRKLERIWIKQKDLECNSLIDEKNFGKESHFSAIECITNMTKERINFLKKYQ